MADRPEPVVYSYREEEPAAFPLAAVLRSMGVDPEEYLAQREAQGLRDMEEVMAAVLDYYREREAPDG